VDGSEPGTMIRERAVIKSDWR